MKITLPAPGTWLNVRQITTLTHGTGHSVADMFAVSDIIVARVAAGTMLRQHIPDALGGVTLYCVNVPTAPAHLRPKAAGARQ